MDKKWAEIIIKEPGHYEKEIVRALENAGFRIVIDYEDIGEKHYIVAREVTTK